jgi:elongation factor Ts
MSLRRFARAQGVLGGYSHMGGSIGVLVELSLDDASKASSETTKILAKDIAMQIAASSPSVLRREDADPKTIETEKSIAREKAKAEGKPEKILDKIAEGAVNKWFAENVLLEQAFVKDDKATVQKHIEKIAKELGTTITVKAMHRFKVGEGLEKRSDDFAAEVAKMAGTG